VDSPFAGRHLIELLIGSIGCPARLADIGVEGSSAIRSLVHEANIERLNNNPRKIDPERLVELLTAAS
jgi:alcohol dehydrogenase class IV